MSLYDKASVALIPSGTKASKLYSVLPANGNGDFTHSRGSTATRVNKDGLIESVATNVPRLDYPLTSGVVGDCPHLLLEPSRTNTITYSENLNSWSKGSGLTITTDNIIAPDGNKTADKVEKTSQNYTFVRQSLTASTGVFSIFVKKGNHRYVGIRNNESNSTAHSVFDFDTESFIVSQANRTLSFDKLPNGWYRLIDYVSVNDSNTFVGICISDSSGNEIGTSIPLNSYIYAWGGQRESGQTYATSYIPNLTTGTTTRSADACDGSGTSAEFNDSEGVLFLETSMLSSNPNNSTFQIDDGTSTNRVRIRFTTTTNQINGLLYSGVSGQPNINYTANDVTNQNKVAIRYQVGQIDLFVNGTKVGTSTGNATPTGFDNLSLGTEGKVKQLIVFNEALSDSELETLTS